MPAIRESRLEAKQRIRLGAHAPAEMQHPRPGRPGPKPFGIHQQCIGRTRQELVARAAQVILGDSAANRRQARRDHPVAQLDDK